MMQSSKTAARIGLGALFLCATISLKAQESINYLLFDANKMQCYDYTVTDNFPRVSNWDFHLKTADGKKLIFRVLKSAIYQDTVESVDKQPFTDATPFTPEMVAAINNTTKYLYILEKKSDKIIISRKVDRVIEYSETPTEISYRDRVHSLSYAYNKIYSTEEKNLSLRKEKGAKVLYQSQEKRECSVLRNFRTFSEHMEDPSEDIKFMEGIGLYSIQVNGKGGEMKLKSINDLPVESYLKNYCAALAKNEVKVLQNAETTNTTNPYANTTTTNPYANTTTTNPYANTTTTAPDTSIKGQKTRTGAYGGTSTNPYGGTLGTGGTTPGTGIPNTEFVITEDPCKGVSPLDLSHPCNQRVVTKQPITAAEPPPADGIYVAQTGDNLYKIANKFGLTTKTLMCLNNKKDYSVGILEKFLVVDKEGKCSQSPNPITRISNETRTITKVHFVEQGETLGKIATKYGITVEKICILNTLTDETKDKIQIDQELIISVESF